MDPSLGAGMTCVKYLLFLINFVFSIIGVFTITIGSVILVNYNNFDLFLESYHLKPAEIIIAVGAITLFTCFLGCIGAFKKSTLIVNIYAIFWLFLVLLEIGLAIFIFVTRCDIYDNVEANMNSKMPYYENFPDVKNSWDVTQELLHCCGVTHAYDWAQYKVTGTVVFHGSYRYTVPYSCCIDNSCKGINEMGCLNILSNYISESKMIFLYVGIGNIVAKIFAYILARMLAKTIRKIKSEQEMERQMNLRSELEHAMGASDTPRNPYSRYYTANITTQ